MLLRSHMDMSLFLRRFEEMSAIHISPRVHRALRHHVRVPLHLTPSDIIALDSRITHMGIIEMAEAVAMLFDVQYQRQVHRLDSCRALELLNIAQEKVGSCQFGVHLPSLRWLQLLSTKTKSTQCSFITGPTSRASLAVTAWRAVTGSSTSATH